MNRGPAGAVRRAGEAGPQLYVVMLQPVKDYAFGIPTDKRLHRDFLIPARFLHDAPTDVKVAVRLALGLADDPPIAEWWKYWAHRAYMRRRYAILLEFGLPTISRRTWKPRRRPFQELDPKRSSAAAHAGRDPSPSTPKTPRISMTP